MIITELVYCWMSREEYLSLLQLSRYEGMMPRFHPLPFRLKGTEMPAERLSSGSPPIEYVSGKLIPFSVETRV